MLKILNWENIIGTRNMQWIYLELRDQRKNMSGIYLNPTEKQYSNIPFLVCELYMCG